jgi:hypothetical protein
MKILKKRGEEETKSMPHAPSQTNQIKVISAPFFRFKNGLVFVLPIKLMKISLFFAD